jgi:hypothetical protein
LNYIYFFKSNDIEEVCTQLIYPALRPLTGYKLSSEAIEMDTKYPIRLKNGDISCRIILGASAEQRLDD